MLSDYVILCLIAVMCIGGGLNLLSEARKYRERRGKQKLVLQKY